MAKFAVDDCRRVNGFVSLSTPATTHFGRGAVFNQPERAHRSCDEIKSATGAGVDTAVLRFDKKRYVRKTAMEKFVAHFLCVFLQSHVFSSRYRSGVFRPRLFGDDVDKCFAC